MAARMSSARPADAAADSTIVVPNTHPMVALLGANDENLRRSRIESAFEESKNVVSTVSDAGYIGHTLKTYIIPWYLWFSRTSREKHFVEDVTKVDIGY